MTADFLPQDLIRRKRDGLALRPGLFNASGLSQKF